MSFRGWQRVLVLSLLLISVITPGIAPTLRAQQESTREESSRKVQNKVTPVYPDLARRMKISGAVKIQVTVAPNGTVKDTKVVGGHAAGECRSRCSSEMALRSTAAVEHGNSGIPL